MGVHAHEDWLFGGVFDVAFDEGDVGFGVDVRFVHNHAEVAVGGRHDAFGQPSHVTLMRHAVADQLGDGEHLQVVLPAEVGELGHAGHRAIVVHDLADDAGGN